MKIRLIRVLPAIAAVMLWGCSISGDEMPAPAQVDPGLISAQSAIPDPALREEEIESEEECLTYQGLVRYIHNVDCPMVIQLRSGRLLGVVNPEVFPRDVPTRMVISFDFERVDERLFPKCSEATPVLITCVTYGR
ncbi:MAG: hypothetical protein SF053_05310 [Bacteroidia bacterium]|nr:hypothetical protein [Bacteroidia bacterium]